MCVLAHSRVRESCAHMCNMCNCVLTHIGGPFECNCGLRAHLYVAAPDQTLCNRLLGAAVKVCGSMGTLNQASWRMICTHAERRHAFLRDAGF